VQLESFHPTLRAWFEETLGSPTPPQERGWPLVRGGGHVLIAAPTGSGKTLAAFLSAIDDLLRLGPEPPDETRVLYVSPLRALSNDVQKNLQTPLDELHERDPELPEIRVVVRTGDTSQSERARMKRRPPHILVTTPETLYILLTSDGGRAILRTVRTVIVDEIHALLGDKRGSHLSLSLERLEALTDEPLQRIGLSATQKPLEDVGRFLVGRDRKCHLVDEGHLREMDLEVVVPDSPLDTICSHETWSEIYASVASLVREHRTTLVFVGTRKLAERISAQLVTILGEEAVACHHSSLSKDRRHDAEQRLKAGKLAVLVATASLELGIDIGDVDLVVQIGTPRSIAALLQRVGRAGHGVGRVPKGRLFPLTRDELVDAAALLRAIHAHTLDRTPQPAAPLDILAQQIVAECVSGAWSEDELFDRMTRAWPYRDLLRENFDAVLAEHSSGRLALLHRDGVHGNLRATKRARLSAITSGGAIPDRADYRVIAEPEELFVGTIDEDFAIESSAGDVFQLGTTSWRVLRVTGGTMRVADAHGAPPNLPFWFGEAPARTAELSGEVGRVREGALDHAWAMDIAGFPEGAATQLHEYVKEGERVLGTVPTQERVVLERFFDETGGMQLVLHAPFGGRTNRALGLALRKRFCRSFGFELQAAANEDSIVLSLGPQHAFPLEEVFDYLAPHSLQDMLVQAVLPLPLFSTRWRWNVCRALLVERMRGGKRVPPPLLRMRADDLLVKAFPAAVACGETLPPGDLDVPLEHPMVAQTVHDCLHEAMDVAGAVRVVAGWKEGRIETVCVDTPEPSVFACSILNAAPYAFLDDAPLEERRTQAVQQRRVLDKKTADELGELSPAAVTRVRQEAWPAPENAEEVHEALLWMGFALMTETPTWSAWLTELAAADRATCDDGRWFAVEASRDPKEVLRGRMEALGPVVSDDPLLVALEADGDVLRCRIEGQEGWCNRRLLARIHRYTLDGLRREIEPVSPSAFLSFLTCWQHVDEEYRLEGPAGVREVVRQLAGFELPAGAWERKILAARVRGYRPTWLDELGLRGEVTWGRLWGDGHSAIRSTPLCLLPREELPQWRGLAPDHGDAPLDWNARVVLECLEHGGAQFATDLASASKLLPSHFETGLAELIARGRVTGDSFAALRWLLAPSNRRRDADSAGGRWSLFRYGPSEEPSAEFVAHALLRRYGVVFRRVLERERHPVPWRDLVRVYRYLELKGDVRGGRFVGGFSGEQYALPEAIPLLRKLRRQDSRPPIDIAASDPLNLLGILTPDARVPVSSRQTVVIG